MAIQINGQIFSDKERKKENKAKLPTRGKTQVGKRIWFLDDLDLYEGIITEDRDDWFYLTSVTNQNIHKNWEQQTSLMPKKDIRFV